MNTKLYFSSITVEVPYWQILLYSYFLPFHPLHIRIKSGPQTVKGLYSANHKGST